MKIKVNAEKQTVSLKGLTTLQFAVIEQLLLSVRLGDATAASDAAFEVLNAIERCEALDTIDLPTVEVSATTNGDIDDCEVWMTSPTLVVSSDIDCIDDEGCGNNCGGCTC